jgi:hypothetical protein
VRNNGISIIDLLGLDPFNPSIDTKPIEDLSAAERQSILDYLNELAKSKFCGDLFEEIQDLMDEIKKRKQDLLDDPQDLYTTNPTGPFSYEGHQKQMKGKQQRLRNLMDEFLTKCGSRVPQNAHAVAYTEVPIKPARFNYQPRRAENNGKLVVAGGVLVTGAVVLYCYTPAGWITIGGVLLFSTAAAY